MRSTITAPEGTAHLLSGIGGVTIYGKTGTAQAGANKPNHAWFSGYLNSTKKNIAFCVLLEHGGSSANAVDVLYKIIMKMQSLGIL
jgi:cell division protein FtsI/penicillin-binding protein 2